MKLGMIVRGDRGGLASQTQGMMAALDPDVVVTMDLGAAGRGAFFWPDTRGAHYDARCSRSVLVEGTELTDEAMRALLLCDVVISVETFYSGEFVWRMAEAGVKTAVVANPELFDPVGLGGVPDLVILPTSWEQDRVRQRAFGARVVVWPMPMPEFQTVPFRRDRAERFVHPLAPAMLDRNGTQLVVAAIAYAERPYTLIFRQHPGCVPPVREGQYGPVRVEWAPETETVEAGWAEGDYDVLVLPRRYGGLCLPQRECAQLGIPAIMPRLSPQSEWPGLCLVKAEQTGREQMKGGAFPTYSGAPERIAAAIESAPGWVLEQSIEAAQWGASLGWSHHAAKWRRRLAAL